MENIDSLWQPPKRDKLNGEEEIPGVHLRKRKVKETKSEKSTVKNC